jgi:hypothetical protein
MLDAELKNQLEYEEKIKSDIMNITEFPELFDIWQSMHPNFNPELTRVPLSKVPSQFQQRFLYKPQ